MSLVLVLPQWTPRGAHTAQVCPSHHEGVGRLQFPHATPSLTCEFASRSRLFVRAAVIGVASASELLFAVSVDESENTPLSEEVGVIISGTWGCIWGCGGGVELVGIELHSPHTFASCSIYFSSMRWRYSGFFQDPDLFLAGFLRYGIFWMKKLVGIWRHGGDAKGRKGSRQLLLRVYLLICGYDCVCLSVC